MTEQNPYTGTGAENAVKPEQKQESTSRKLAGKYETIEELEKGHDHLQHTLTERTTELANERALKAELEKALVTVADRVSPADRMRSRTQAEEALEQQGLPLTALDQYISERIARAVPQVLDEKLKPITEGTRTQRMLEEEFPGVNPVDVSQFLRSNPEVRDRYDAKLQAGSVEAAAYYAYARYAQSEHASRDLSGLAEQQGKARRDAALPSASAPERTTDEGPSLADAYDRYLTEGDKTTFLLKRLDFLPGIKPNTR